MGRLQMGATDSRFEEYDRRLKKLFINGQNNENNIDEIIKELIALKDTSEVSSEQLLMWT